MSVELEKALAEKCANDPRLELLQAQWVYDKRLATKALQTVGNSFPHYSLHDASHSNTILVQVTRVLGDRIYQLSATDIWLLLESAYWHDMGMVVDDATVRRWWDTPEFQLHLDMLIEVDDQMLADAARLVRSQNSVAGLQVLDIRKAVTLVVADFARRHHASRSGHLVAHPLDIGVESPRTLIPRRLFQWLAEISVSHGGSQSLIQELPYAECGVGTDLCHPRFIACMLRLGDLLDLDNGRFCPVLAGSIGEFPSSSKVHVDKHASIRRFHVDPSKIEVEAVCRLEKPTEAGDPYGAFEAVTTWLDWLQDEVKFLASRWADIAPPDFGGAPSLGRIEARLEGFLCFGKNERPKFSVDESAFLKLVRSNSLYDQRHAWLRELISNADDATRIRVFDEHKKEILEDKSHDPDVPFLEFRKRLDRHPINVSFSQIADEPKRWGVVIEDQGTGISREDLQYILTIGSSRKNPARRQIIREMNEYFKPTGSFGIGLQSIFMVTNDLMIVTTHYKTRETLRIRIKRGERVGDEAVAKDTLSASRKQPTGVYVEKVPANEAGRKPGSQLEFQVTLEPSNESQQAESQINLHGSRAKELDPILGELGKREIEELGELLKDSSTHLLTPIYEKQERLSKEFSGELAEPDEEIWIFSAITNCLVKFSPPTISDNPILLRYRGAEVKNHGLGKTSLMNVTLDIQSGEASQTLSASRDSLLPNARPRVRNLFDQAIADVFPRYLERLRETTPEGTAK